MASSATEKPVVFYSWQSDLPNKTNRTLIQDALEEAAKSLKAQGAVTVEPVIDRDTQGVPGAPDIGQAIFGKIDGADVFVCDVSFIDKAETGHRRTPNPNVLVELGYALRALTWERVVMVLNLATGRTEDLPFDLKQKRILTYCSAEDDAERAPARKDLAAKLTEALRAILQLGSKNTPEQKSPATEALTALKAGGPRTAAAVADYMEDLSRQIAAANSKPKTGEGLVVDIESQTANVMEFMQVAGEVASQGDLGASLEMHRGFGKILQLYQFPPRKGGFFSNNDFDLPKFVGHELFTSFIALHIKRGHIEQIGELLREPLVIDDANGNGLRPFSRLSTQVGLLNAYYVSKGQRYQSPHGAMLRERHAANPDLTRIVPWGLFMGTDYFLYLHSVMGEKLVYKSRWTPWSYPYMGEEGVPDWLARARSQKWLSRLCQAFGLDTETFRERYGEAVAEADRFFGDGFPPLDGLPIPAVLGSIE